MRNGAVLEITHAGKGDSRSTLPHLDSAAGRASLPPPRRVRTGERVSPFQPGPSAQAKEMRVHTFFKPKAIKKKMWITREKMQHTRQEIGFVFIF